ncbi:PREDICTED: chloride transport protein 6-like [Amphimedon queenslandica]|uniref:Chloride channel protein n=1 Tax=Amphimedon queenslandica TaxID=400682 RepID=A0AAN0IZL3_AMPQE|nr:PREDICTED: chloride transport protein 6-like [Amphimedon queenslandica]|eukprot:XP_019849977.1 PREDICTED: chloride transport protein 6-like [Amphimedon queenslandica]
MRWVMVALIGIVTGTIAFLINVGIHYLRLLKYQGFFRVYELTRDSGTIFLALLVIAGFNVFCSIFAGILVAIEPIAAGSGIPEIKCYLNGIRMPRVARIRTLMAKACGVLFSVAGGFLVGKEGPMIHTGAIVGAGIPQLRSFIWKKLRLPYPYFRDDKNKRDFVSCGAAAGVAAAFGAPIGGVLFSLEEGSSFWDQGLTWRSLFCAMCSTITLNLLLTGTPLVPEAKFGELDQPGLINFGRFSNGGSGGNLWTFPYLFLFILIGAGGGLLGAWFNSLNKRLTIYRMKHVFRKNFFYKMLEVILIAMVTTVSFFILATLLGTCVPVITRSEQQFANSTRNFFCPTGVTFSTIKFNDYFNDLATLMFNSEEDSIKQLFHQDGAFTLPTLGLAFICYYFIACWTYGAGLPSGLFVPCLTIGALYGRFIITAMQTAGIPTAIDPGTFALIGAAAFLGGVVRMTVSLTVILIESTDEIEYGLPLLVTLMVAKWVGDLFNEGLYDIHIEVKEIPLLGWDSPEKVDRLTATDVMNPDLKYIYPISNVGNIERLLTKTKHNAFFVVTAPLSASTEDTTSSIGVSKQSPLLYKRQSMHPIHRTKLMEQRRRRKEALKRKEYKEATINDDGESSGATPFSSGAVEGLHDNANNAFTFLGLILRSQLVKLMHNRIFFDEENGVETQHCIKHEELNEDYPRFKRIDDIELKEEDKRMQMDVSLYMNPCPYTVSYHAPLRRVFNLFRTMGLRHLPVIDNSGKAVGMITRHDLTHEHLHKALHAKSRHSNNDNDSNENDGKLDVADTGIRL